MGYLPMSNVSGSIAVNVEFRDSTSVANVQSLKTISLRDTKDYATGKVAIVSGTVGTTAVELWSQGGGISFGGYKNASGNTVSLGQVARIALQASGLGAKLEDADLDVVELFSVNNEVSIGNNIGLTLFVSAIDGTSAFTAVLYGS
jgi:hypothetical protein